MNRTILSILLSVATIANADAVPEDFSLAGTIDKALLFAVSSGTKVRPDSRLSDIGQKRLFIATARNEAEAVQLVIRPTVAISNLTAEATDLIGPEGAIIGANQIEILRVQFVTTTLATDSSTTPGQWPDPLPPLEAPIDRVAEKNQSLWLRVTPPAATAGGTYTGHIKLTADNYTTMVPLQVLVYDFVLPDRMTCTTAFGFSASNVFKYHNLTDPKHKRLVIDKYFANFASHHISPYNPAPLDSIKTTWPDITPPPSRFSNWDNIRIVQNESHTGDSSLLIHDIDPEHNTTVTYKPLIEIPPKGLTLNFAWRSAIPDQRSLVTVEHYDTDGKWMSGRNNDIAINSDGKWQQFSRTLNAFPENARFVRLRFRAARWSESGDQTGLIWFDDIALINPQTKEELIEAGDFETVRRTEKLLSGDKLKPVIDFSAWDTAMARAIDHYKFNSFRVDIPGIGGGTYHAISPPNLRGFGEDAPEYPIMFDSYCRQLQAHFTETGWIDYAYIYWFDEPSPDQYAFLMNGFEKLKRSCPDIDRMLTEQPEPQLNDGPNIYCVVSYLYDHDKAQDRRSHGDRFWWYICTGPKAPYCTLFIDHPATELRVWLWQTWQRNIEGILIWQSNYWTSSVAYPDPDSPQNPYEDPMGWVSGYSTPSGSKKPWGNGDGRFIYPPLAAADAKAAGPILDGPVDSIRWEMLRDGIEDYEYLTILKELLAQKKSKLTGVDIDNYAKLLTVPKTITKDLTHFTTDPKAIQTHRHNIAIAIEKLSRL
jgi:hypothetical protein